MSEQPTKKQLAKKRIDFREERNNFIFHLNNELDLILEQRKVHTTAKLCAQNEICFSENSLKKK